VGKTESAKLPNRPPAAVRGSIGKTKGSSMRRHLIPLTLSLLLATACGGTAGSDDTNDPTATGGSGPAAGGTGGSTAATGGTDPGAGGNAGMSSAGSSAATGGVGTGGTNGLAGMASGGGGAVAPTVEDCPTAELPRTPLRRLTRFEYANSVRQLLGVDPAPAATLPPDEVTNSFDNNALVLTVSALHAEKYVLVSETLAKQAVQDLTALTSCDTAATGEEACALEFARRFGRRAFRRPITASDEAMLMAAYAAGKTGGTHAEGIEVMIRAALQSSNFLYRLETTTPADSAPALVPLSQFELATRLSYLIWSSGPDDDLLDAAASGALATPAAVAAKAREMLASPNARGAVAHFFDQWAGTTRLDIVTKSSDVFPAFTPAVKAAMQKELPAFVEHVLWSGDHLLSTLFTSESTVVTSDLAAIYGITAPAGSDTTPTLVMLPASQGRAGILTQPGFLSVQAHPDQTSPVLRGKFVRSMLLCDPPDPPPDDVNITVPSIDQGGTARERFSAHLTAGASCNGCHTGMDPIGLAFENFDAMGQYRTMENGKPIDVSGEILDTEDSALAGPFVGVLEMAQKLAGSGLVQNCMATQWFRFAVGRTEVQPDSCSLATLQTAFGAAGGDLNELIVGITQTDAFLYRAPVTP
jgi:hypothetical protein